MRTWAGVGLILCLMAGRAVPAHSQSNMIDLFGAMVQSGVGMAAQAAWEKLPSSEIACVNRYLLGRGSSINKVIQQGINPTDPRVFDARSECRDSGSAAAPRRRPSFDCSRASMPDERMICADEEAAQLDVAMAAGYAYVKGGYGDQTARMIGAPLLQARQSCGANLACIKQAQRAAIREYQLRGAAITVPEARTAPALPAATPYSVDGLALGGRVAVDSPSYADYRCGPSEQYPGFTWCQRRKTESSSRGAYASSNSILHSRDGVAFYINRYLEPAFFSGNEANDDINRLASKFGPPRVIQMPRQPDIPNGIIASWGNVRLEPLEPVLVSQLATGQEVRAGLLIDHIGNFRKSAQRGLPIYRIGGGAGFVWAASWNAGGVGTLRFLATDASALASATRPPDSSRAPEPAPAQPPTAASAMAAPVIETAPPEAAIATAPIAKPKPESAVQATVETREFTETSAALERIRSTIKRIGEQRDGLPSTEQKARLDDIAARLATASETTELAALRGLLRDCDAALAVFGEAADFRQISAIASRKIETVEATLVKLTFEAPIIAENRSAIEALKTAQSNGSVASLKAALAKVIQTYDADKLARLAEARSQGFDSTESYEDHKASQAKLSKSGIRLNAR